MAIYKDVEPLEVVMYKSKSKGFDEGVNFILEKLDALPVANEWISVKDRLPDEEERVLVAVDSDKSDTKIDTDRMIYRQWVRWGLSVTHWMPLPEPPKKEGADNEKL